MPLELHPPRRDPRVLLLRPQDRFLRHAALDAWEIRGVGTLPFGTPAAFRTAITRVVIQTRPSVIVLFRPRTRSWSTAHGRAVETLAHRRGLPVLHLTRVEERALQGQALSAPEILDAYPELRTIERASELRTVALALAALTHHSLPPRRYVSRLAARPAPRLDARPPRCSRPPPVPHGPPARRPPG